MSDAILQEHAAPACRLQNISIQFDGTPVLKNINFTLETGEVHALVGKNGAGKSTLMKILTGVYTPTEGTIRIFGKNVKPGHSQEIRKHGISMVYQDLSLIPSMTVSQNIFLSTHPFKKLGILQDGAARKKAREILASMGVDFISPDALVEHVSAGEAQLIEIAKALASEPKIIVFDEPTASLSEIEIAQLFKIIKTLKARGISIIYITHYLKDIMTVCDTLTVFRDGMTVFTGRTADVSIPDIVQHMIGFEAPPKETRNNFVNAADAAPLLSVTNAATKSIRPVSFSVQQGEIVGFAGLLGSGRTEILRMLYGLDPLISGSIEMRGKPVSLKHPADAKALGIALIPEERRTQGLVLDFSIEHNLSLGALQKFTRLGLLSGAQSRAISQKTIADFQVKARDEKQLVRFLSGGNQQKVVFGKSLLSEPSILLLDDPTFGVDVHAKSEIMKFIEDYAARGNAAILVSTELEEIASFCHRTYVIKKKQVAQELRNELLTEGDLLKLVQ